MKRISSLLLLLTILISSIKAQTAQEAYDLYQDIAVFETPMAISLKKGVKEADIAKMKDESLRAVATLLLKGDYDPSYRFSDYEAVLDPTVLGQQLGIGDGYSKYDNVTGVYLPKGSHVVLVDGVEEGDVNLVVPYWHRKPAEGVEPTKDPNGWGLHKKTFPLRNGVNAVNLDEWDGLAYVQYFSAEPDTKKPIQIHFPNAQVNGYFDISKHTDADWNRLLQNAVYPIIDGLGKHIQIAYPVEAGLKYANNRGVELITNYDSLVYLQHELMGLVKYDIVPKNRILSRVNYNYYMFRDGDGVAYMGGESGYAMGMVVDPNRVILGDPCWGFSHEVGHVHQLRPYFNWGGLGEVSNNVFSLFVNTHFGTVSRILAQDNYTKSRESIVEGGISYLQDEDVFNRLVPFWQLQLYFAGEGNNPDFYPDLFEAFRQQIEKDRENPQGRSGGRGSDWGARGGNPAPYQLNFVKTACEVSKTDLTDFFDQYGFFNVGEFQYNDYGNYTYEMTQDMVDECKAAIKAMNLPKPKVDISMLQDENVGE